MAQERVTVDQEIPVGSRSRTFLRYALGDQRGQLIPMVLAVMVIIIIISSAFVMNLVVRQNLGGRRYRVTAARYLAEAALERARWALESGAADPASVFGSLDIAKSAGGTQEGRFRVQSLSDEGDGLVSVVAIGEFAGVQRAIRAQIKLSPRVLSYALFGQGFIQLEGNGSHTYLIPAPIAGGSADGGHLGTNTEVRLMNAGIVLNDFSGLKLSLRDGDQPDYALLGLPAPPREEQRTGKVVLSAGAGITFGTDRESLNDPERLRGRGIRMGMAVVSTPERETLPRIDLVRLRGLAEANVKNAEVNEAVAAQIRPSLRGKRDSLYEPGDFIYILGYLARQPGKPLRGPIYVKGPFLLPQGLDLQIFDGFLAVEGSLMIVGGARLEVHHTPSARLFPGIVTVGADHPLVVQKDGVLVVDGLVYTGGLFDAGDRSVVDITGALIAADSRLSIRNHNATLVIRYNPTVLDTIGFLTQGRTLARVVVWEEVRR